MPLASVGEIVLDYERSGEGPPLLAIMGMSGTALHWGEAFLEPLREHFEVIVYDHRGVGASSRLDGPVTISGWRGTRRACSSRSRWAQLTCSASRWAGWSRRSWCSRARSWCAR